MGCYFEKEMVPKPPNPQIVSNVSTLITFQTLLMCVRAIQAYYP
jgi:hypothetical protein